MADKGADGFVCPFWFGGFTWQLKTVIPNTDSTWNIIFCACVQQAKTG